jgi:hypothetical protein
VSNQRDNKVRNEQNYTQKRSVSQGHKVNSRAVDRGQHVNKSTNNAIRKPNVQKQRISSNERNKNNAQRVTQNKNREASVSKSKSSRDNNNNSKRDLKRKNHKLK